LLKTVDRSPHTVPGGFIETGDKKKNTDWLGREVLQQYKKNYVEKVYVAGGTICWTM